MKEKMLLVATIFLGSFVSFALEPMIGRALLPVFGGTPGVWIVCLAAFQILMVGGYFYGGCVSGRRRSLVNLHLALLALAGGWCVYLSKCGAGVLRFTSTLTGVGPLDVLLSVLVLVGVAFVLLSANATLVQNLSGGDYRLYAVSNLGSFLGLFAYPLLVEPFVGLSMQWQMLGVAILAYAAILFLAARGGGRGPEIKQTNNSSVDLLSRPTFFSRSSVLYLLIPAISCALLNAVTTHLTLDIAPLPLLWAILLGLFLLSYVIGFSGKSKVWVWCAVGTAGAAYALSDMTGAESNNVVLRLGASAALLFGVTTFLHSWLYAIRPGKEGLGRYYLLNVIGGAIGGSAVSIVAPLVFPAVYEYPVMVVLSCVALACYAVQAGKRKTAIGLVAVFAAAVALGFALRDEKKSKSVTIHQARGFFGTMRVGEVKAGSSDGQAIAIHEFVHGETIHGVQVMRKEMERMPTCYFLPYGCGFSVAGHWKYREKRPMRVGIVGLGIGVMFAYGRPGDTYRGYEISPEVLATAQDPRFFTFVPHCLAKTELVLGDARKEMEKERAAGLPKYDVLLIDAFTGDNLPYHLSTKEALTLYLSMLEEDGVLCINFTNKHLDLRPYVKRIAEEMGLSILALSSDYNLPRLGYATNAAIFTRHPEKIGALPKCDVGFRVEDFTQVKGLAELPTDDKGSFLPLVRLTTVE